MVPQTKGGSRLEISHAEIRGKHCSTLVVFLNSFWTSMELKRTDEEDMIQYTSGTPPRNSKKESIYVYIYV